ncbi:MAG: hypothetical protein LBI48_13180 [Burkholderiaceae bacterium]|jgi:hypothetical protein|nr:hypothetical protein [Burkholderiaceae bacterium]
MEIDQISDQEILQGLQGQAVNLMLLSQAQCALHWPLARLTRRAGMYSALAADHQLPGRFICTSSCAMPARRGNGLISYKEKQIRNLKNSQSVG